MMIPKARRHTRRWNLLPQSARVASAAALAAGWLALHASTALAEPVAQRAPSTTPIVRRIAQAERAYQEVDFASVRREASEALATGGATREQTARLHELSAIAEAALGDEENAKKSFIAALAVRPDARLDRSLSPKIRGPYLEAQGFWGAYPERLAVRAKLSADRTSIAADLTDPANLVATLSLHVRKKGAKTYRVFDIDASPSQRFPLEAVPFRDGLEYFVAALDKSRNVLAEAGSESDPLVASAIEEHLAERSAKRTEPGRSYVFPILFGATGLAAVGAGVAFQLRRESAAREWNGPDCERPGASRLQQCGDVDSRVRSNQSLAIAGFAAGAALLGGSVIALVAGRTDEPVAEHRPTAARVSSCGALPNGFACSGHF